MRFLSLYKILLRTSSHCQCLSHAVRKHLVRCSAAVYHHRTHCCCCCCCCCCMLYLYIAATQRKRCRCGLSMQALSSCSSGSQCSCTTLLQRTQRTVMTSPMTSLTTWSMTWQHRLVWSYTLALHCATMADSTEVV
jgi:hypothetical protein